MGSPDSMNSGGTNAAGTNTAGTNTGGTNTGTTNTAGTAARERRFPRLQPRVLGSRFSMAVWLTFAWVLLWGTPELGTIAAGFLAALTVMILMPLPRVPVEGLVRPLSTLWLIVMVAFYLLRSSVHVAWLSIRPAAPPRAAVLRAPMRLKSDFCLALAVNTLNLMPGGIVVRIDPLARYVYVHVLDAGTDEAVARFHAQVATVEKLYLNAFERPDDWRPDVAHYCAPDEEYQGGEYPGGSYPGDTSPGGTHPGGESQGVVTAARQLDRPDRLGERDLSDRLGQRDQSDRPDDEEANR